MVRRALFLFAIVCGWTLPVLPALHAQQRDVRLIEAVKRRDQKAFAALLQAKAYVNAVQPDGATALAWAVHLGERRMAEALLAAGADANAADEYDETPVTVAAANADAALVQRLLAAGGNARGARWNGETAVMIAAGAGSLDVVRQLVRHGADVNAAEPRGGQTALMWAAAEGHSDVVAGLIELGANVSAASRAARGGGGFGRGGAAGEQTPLMMAARADHEDVMRALVAAGADPARKAQDGTSVLMAAAAGARLTTLKYAYEIDPHVDVVTTTGNTPMHVAVALNGRTQREVVEVIAFLADHGARLDEMNRAGRTPIAIADGLPVDLAVDLLTRLIIERGGVPKIPSKR